MNNMRDEGITDEATHIAHELRTLWHGLIRESGREAHLDRQQYWVLVALDAGPQRMSALAEHAQTSQASLTGIIDRLEDHGLVERLRSDEDRRCVDVSITGAGREMLDQARAVFTGHLERTLAPLGPVERAVFLGILRKLNVESAGRGERS